MAIAWTIAVAIIIVIFSYGVRVLSQDPRATKSEDFEFLVLLFDVINVLGIIGISIASFIFLGPFSLSFNIEFIAICIFVLHSENWKPSKLVLCLSLSALVLFIAGAIHFNIAPKPIAEPTIETNTYAIISAEEYGIDNDTSTTEYMFVKDVLSENATYILYYKTDDGGIVNAILNSFDAKLYYFVENETPRIEETITTTYQVANSFNDKQIDTVTKTYKIYIPKGTLAKLK